MLRVMTIAIMAVATTPAWAERGVRAPAPDHHTPQELATLLPDNLGNGVVTGSGTVGAGLSGHAIRTGVRSGQRQHHRDCMRLVLAMDHLIALMHDHEGPIPNPVAPVSSDNSATVLLEGMSAVKNLCGEQWEMTSNADATAENIRNTDSLENQHE